LIAVDTNILVYSHRREHPWHLDAKRCLQDLAEGNSTWLLLWQCIHEFIGVATNAKLWKTPSTLVQAFDQVEVWMKAPTAVFVTEDPGYWHILRDVLTDSRVTGPRVHDARIAALCLQHGVTTLWSADRDFSRFGRLKVVNPLVRRTR
jgi:hypothetical protein